MAWGLLPLGVPIPEGDYLSSPVSRPVPEGDYARPVNALAAGIVETASALGMDPIDLATIISYETAGTFDPARAGPTTQWGQHRGLIQFGEPQARQYGVDWNDPIGSQLGADGAIVDYFRDAGWQPGMGLLDAYSAVNAGRVGRYNASDANNGGAPGTVRDKVEGQMDGHRRKAAALLGMEAGSYSPPQNALAREAYPDRNIDPVAMIEAAQRQREQFMPAQEEQPYSYALPQNALADAAPQYDTRRYLTERLMRG